MSKIGRNEACPCGSGKKYKRCCGAVDAPPPQPRYVEAAEKTTQRECGECAVCCEGWLIATVLDFEMKVGKPCPHNTGHGCGIYERRPQDPCRAFQCGWLMEGSLLPDSFRPDKSDCILITRVVWNGMPVDAIIPRGKTLRADTFSRLKEYAKRHNRILVYPDGQGNAVSFGPTLIQAEFEVFLRSKGEDWWFMRTT